MSKRIVALLMVCVMVLCGCTNTYKNNGSYEYKTDVSEKTDTNDSDLLEKPFSDEPTPTVITSQKKLEDEIKTEDNVLTVDNSDNSPELSFYGLSDPKLLQYIQDDIAASVAQELGSDDYKVESVRAIYLSDEYLEDIEFNSKSNIYFGYSLEDVYKQFGNDKFIFTLGDEGQTVVAPFEEYDDTWDQVVKNVAIGTGVILVCVVVSVASAGAGAAAISCIFAAAAKTGTLMAVSNGVLSGVTAGVVEGIQSHSFDEALKAGALAGSNGFKWGAIIGSVTGGVNQAITIKNASGVDQIIYGNNETIPTPKESEKYALDLYHGDEQVAFLDKVKVPANTPNSTRPDLLRKVDDVLEAIEVKNYDLVNHKSQLLNELKRQISQRVTDLPDGTLQRIVLDTRGRGYTEEFVEVIKSSIWEKLADVYPNIPIDVIF